MNTITSIAGLQIRASIVANSAREQLGNRQMNALLTPVRLDRPATHRVHVAIKNNDHDEFLHRAAQSRITNCQYAEVRFITFELVGQTIILRGQVSSFYLKQVAQEAVRSLEGIERIRNHVKVHDRQSNQRIRTR